MSVFTLVNPSELTEFLAAYGINEAHHLTPIPSSTHNSNYKIICDGLSYMLTIFESMPNKTAEQVLSAVSGLKKQGLPVPRIFHAKDGSVVGTMCTKPAALAEYLKGSPARMLSPEHCEKVGQFLAKLHQQPAPNWTNTFDINWFDTTVAELSKVLNQAEKKLMQSGWDELRDVTQNLPTTFTHGHLFTDNALFDGEVLVGVVNLYDASAQSAALDLAVMVNDWCFDKHHALKEEHYKATMQAYWSIRPFNSDEEQAWPKLLALAALKVWIMRANAKHLEHTGPQLSIGDTKLSKQLFEHHMSQPVALS